MTSATVTNGGSTTVTIVAPTNSFATAEGVYDRCGSMSAAVYDNNNGSDVNPTNNWASVSGPDFSTNDYTLTIDTSLKMDLIGESSTTTITIYIKTTIVDYNTQTQYTQF